MLVEKHVCIHACISIGSDNTFAHAADYTQHDGIHAYVAENEATVHYVHACKNTYILYLLATIPFLLSLKKVQKNAVYSS